MAARGESLRSAHCLICERVTEERDLDHRSTFAPISHGGLRCRRYPGAQPDFDAGLFVVWARVPELIHIQVRCASCRRRTVGWRVSFRRLMAGSCRYMLRCRGGR